MNRLAKLIATCALTIFGPLTAAANDTVDVQLVLAIDVSRSIEAEEYEIQQEGYASALVDPAVVGAMLSGPYGRVAVVVVEWAGQNQQRIIAPWQVLATASDAVRLSESLGVERPRFWRRTSISSMLLYGASLIENSGFASTRRVIDISGDGPNNEGPPVLQARQQVLARGITVNGLPLLTRGVSMNMFDMDQLDEYYHQCVVGGPGSFVIPVTRWEEFAETVRRKLVLELAGIAPPARLQRVAAVDCTAGESVWSDRMDFYGIP